MAHHHRGQRIASVISVPGRFVTLLVTHLLVHQVVEGDDLVSHFQPRVVREEKLGVLPTHDSNNDNKTKQERRVKQPG